MACSTCDCQFATRTEQRQHYKFDWHRYNLRQKAVGLPSVSEEEFESKLTGDISSISCSDTSSESESDEDEDLSPTSRPHKIKAFSKYLKPLSGASGTSESETDDDSKSRLQRGRKYPKIYFKNEDGQIVSVYRCIIHGKKNPPVTQNELIYKTGNLLQQLNWCVLMVAGGHFAGAIFNREKVLVHKTFHRYTVRAKRGTSQGMKDNQSGGHGPKSAGASLRRYNEAALIQDIHNLLDEWKDSLSSCDHIFIRAPSFNKAIFFSGKNSHFDKKDPRIITIPFSTRRPTFAEVKRIHIELATIECYGNEEDVADLLPWSPKPKLIPRRLTKQKGNSKKSPKQKLVISAAESTSKSEPLQVPKTEVIDLANTQDNSEGNITKSSSNLVPDIKTNDIVTMTTTDDKEESDRKQVEEIRNVQLDSESEEDSDAEASLSLEYSEHISSTLHLREFEVVKKKPRKKRKNTAKEKGESQVEEKHRPGTALYQLRNDLYTACKVGDEELLQNILLKITNTSSEKTDEHSGESEIVSISKVNPPTEVDPPTEIMNPTTEIKSEQTTSTKDLNILSKEQIPKSENLGNVDNNIAMGAEGPETRVTQIDSSSLNTEDKNDGTSAVGQTIENTPESDEVTPEVDCSNNIQNAGTSISMSKVEILNDSFANDGRTLLHIAAKAGQRKIVRSLLEADADPSIRDKNGKPSYVMACDKPTRNEFRKFMADFPDKYDYTKAQIPCPLTSEMEENKAAKMAEKKKEKKKAKKEKLKEQKIDERKRKEEEREKQWFTSLSDREKRALAAERRLVQQMEDKDIRRCWSCGDSLTGKVPFEYMDFKFCTMKCLKKHKQQQQPEKVQQR
ncbi:tRNA endonuclease ANKZF1-like [Glandiceps talaboti]